MAVVARVAKVRGAAGGEIWALPSSVGRDVPGIMHAWALPSARLEHKSDMTGFG